MNPAAALLTLPVSELLALWTELEEARHGTAAFGGDTAEVYAYRLRRASPARELGALRGRTPTTDAAVADEDLAAARAFHDLLALFAELHPGIRLEVDGRAFGPWVAREPNAHRWRVFVEERR